MAQITLKGNPINTCGKLPPLGSSAPDFQLTASDLSETRLTDFRGKNVIMNIVPSFDTGVCAASVRRFNQAAAELDDVVIINISKDLPFAQKRFCESEGLAHVKNLSAFRSPRFGHDYGIELIDGPLRGLLGRAVVVINGAGQVVYTELVPEIAQEPQYDAALSAVAQLA